jgi:hypothetical protein
VKSASNTTPHRRHVHAGQARSRLRSLKLGYVVTVICMSLFAGYDYNQTISWGRHMEAFILISQAVNLSVIFSVVALFLLTWHWPASLLSFFLCVLFLYLFREKATARSAQSQVVTESLNAE